MSALVHASTAEDLHIMDLPYRLSSWAFEDRENIGLWVDETERLIAWAVMQTPMWAIDYAYLPTSICAHPRPYIVLGRYTRAPKCGNARRSPDVVYQCA